MDPGSRAEPCGRFAQLAVSAVAESKANKPPLPTRTETKYLPPWETGEPGPVTGIVEMDTRDPYDFRHVHPKTQALRRLFVAEFIKDYNGSAAIARLGLEFSQPAMIANVWLKEPFTQHVLDLYVREVEQDALVTRNQVIAALVREANYFGLDSSGAARVSALGKLARILGMEKIKVEGEIVHRGGIMLVPIAANPDEWEKHAAGSQKQLKQAAKA